MKINKKISLPKLTLQRYVVGPRIISPEAMLNFREFCPDNFWIICPDWNYLFQSFFKFVRTSEIAIFGPKIVRIMELSREER